MNEDDNHDAFLPGKVARVFTLFNPRICTAILFNNCTGSAALPLAMVAATSCSATITHQDVYPELSSDLH